MVGVLRVGHGGGGGHVWDPFLRKRKRLVRAVVHSDGDSHAVSFFPVVGVCPIFVRMKSIPDGWTRVV